MKLISKSIASMSVVFVFLLGSSQAMAQKNIDKFVADTKNKLTNDFNDPEATRFRNLEVREKVGNEGKKYLNLCGEFNAKNRVGAYTGYQKFYGTPTEVLMINAPSEDSPGSQHILNAEMMMRDFSCGEETKLIKKISK